MAEMKIQIGADVQQAVSGLNQVAVSANKTTGALAKLPTTSNQATNALTNLSRVAQDAPYGFIGIANNLNPLLESFQRLKVSTGSTGGALKALGKELTGAGGLGLALGIVSSLAVVFGDKLFGAGAKAEAAKKKTDELKQSIDGVFSSMAKEATQAGAFVTILRNETETRERKLAAIKELQRIQPEIFKGLKLEGDAVVGLDSAYQNYLSNLRNVIAAKIIQAKLEQKIEELLRLQGVALSASEKSAVEFFKNIKKQRLDAANELSGEDAAKLELQFKLSDEKNAAKEKQLQNDIQSLFKNLGEFSKNIELKTPVDKLKINPKKIEIEKRPGLGSVNLELPTAFDTPEISKLQKQINERAKEIGVTIPIGIDLSKPGKGFQNLQDSAQQPFIQIQQRMKALAGVVSDTLTPVFQSFFTTISQGGNAFKAFAQAAGQALIGLISKLATTALLAAILGPLLGAGTAIGASTSKFGDVFKFLSGFGGFRAGGGPVSGGRSYIVGERGPEVFMPSSSGNIIPNGAGRVGMGNMAGLLGQVEFRISGNNLVGVLSAANRSQRRLA